MLLWPANTTFTTHACMHACMHACSRALAHRGSCRHTPTFELFLIQYFVPYRVNGETDVHLTSCCSVTDKKSDVVTPVVRGRIAKTTDVRRADRSSCPVSRFLFITLFCLDLFGPDGSIDPPITKNKQFQRERQWQLWLPRCRSLPIAMSHLFLPLRRQLRQLLQQHQQQPRMP